MKYEIVDIDFPNPSFSWANGLYIIVGKIGLDKIKIARLNYNGNPDMIHDGTEYDIAITGAKNPGIKRTGKYYIDNRFRKEKLKRILK